MNLRFGLDLIFDQFIWFNGALTQKGSNQVSFICATLRQPPSFRHFTLFSWHQKNNSKKIFSEQKCLRKNTVIWEEEEKLVENIMKVTWKIHIQMNYSQVRMNFLKNIFVALKLVSDTSTDLCSQESIIIMFDSCFHDNKHLIH